MEPRTVHLTFRKHNKRFLKSSAPIPVILHLSRDARAEALRFYLLLFGTRRYRDLVYFSPELDTLYFGPVERFGIVEDDPSIQKWWWHTEQVSRFKTVTTKIGSGYHELQFFMRETRPFDVKQIRFLSIEAGAALMGEVRLLRFIRKFLALEDFTLCYFDANKSAKVVAINVTRDDMLGKICRAFLTIDQNNPDWRQQEWKTEYVQAESAAGRA